MSLVIAYKGAQRPFLEPEVHLVVHRRPRKPEPYAEPFVILSAVDGAIDLQRPALCAARLPHKGARLVNPDTRIKMHASAKEPRLRGHERTRQRIVPAGKHRPHTGRQMTVGCVVEQ